MKDIISTIMLKMIKLPDSMHSGFELLHIAIQKLWGRTL